MLRNTQQDSPSSAPAEHYLTYDDQGRLVGATARSNGTSASYTVAYDERGNASRIESAGRTVYEIVYDHSFLPRTAAVPADVFVTPSYGDHAVGAAIQACVAMPQTPRMLESIPLAVDRAYNGQNLHLSI